MTGAGIVINALAIAGYVLLGTSTPIAAVLVLFIVQGITAGVGDHRGAVARKPSLSPESE